MTDVTEPAPRPRWGRAGRFDFPRAAFWAAICMGAAGAGVTVAAGPSVGPVGAVLLIGVATTGIVFLMWLMGLGKFVGLYPARGATEAASFAVSRSEFGLIEALDEPAFVAEHASTPVVANAAYMAAANAAGALGESARPPAMDRLFGADPVVAAPMYRLANAAKRGQGRREELPATAIGRGALKRYEASVAPMPGGRTLWRLRDLGGLAQDETAPADPRRLFIDEAPIGFLSARPDGSVAYMNQALRAVLGVGEPAVGLKLRELIKEDPARLLRRDRKSFGPVRAEITLRARDGMETPALALTSWPAADGDGASRTLIYFNGQEAPAEGAGAAPRAPSGPIDGFFENAPFGAAVLDSADGAIATILDSNPALMELAQGRATPGASFADLFDASEGPAELTRKLRAAAHDPVELMLATSPPRAVHVHFARGGDGNGLAFVVNVAEQREIEQRLAQSEKMREIGTLASGVAHDFNNNLTVVLHSTEFLLSRHPVGDPDFEDLNKINAYSLRSRELTEKLLAVARQKTLKREITDVSAMIVEVHQFARRVVGDKIEFKVNHARDLPYIKVDQTELSRVLVNLVANARDAINARDEGRGGKLTISSGLASGAEAQARGHHTVAEGAYVVIDVADNGAGISPEDQARVFRSFFSTKEPGKGTGLGLTTSYNIVKQLGGYIFFDSAVGQGTTFRIYMPAYEMTPEDHEEMARRDRERLQSRGKDLAARGKILLVEDEDGVRLSLARTLKGFGCEIVQAENGEDALDVLAANPGAFDLIVSDVSMPFMTGPEMLRAMTAEQLGKAKVLFLSGYAPEGFGKLLEEYPVSFASKPVGAAELAQKVRELLGL